MAYVPGFAATPSPPERGDRGAGAGDEEIVSALRRQLSWTHFRRLIYVEDPRQREFYAEMCQID